MSRRSSTLGRGPGEVRNGTLTLVLRLAFGAALILTALSFPVSRAQTALGNGIIDPGEACDDGNTVGGDGCSATGQIEGQCYDPGNKFSFFLFSDSYTSAGSSGLTRLLQDSVSRTRYPNRVIPRFWISTGDIPFMDTSLSRLDTLNNAISDTKYPFSCAAGTKRFPYFVALGNHDIGGYVNITPQAQLDYWSNYLGPRLPTALLGAQNFTWGPDLGYDARTTYSFDYKNAHFVVVNQYFGDPGSAGGPVACIRQTMMDWIDQDLASTDRPLKFVIGHEPAWSHCSNRAGYGGSSCPIGHPDNLDPPFRPRPYSTTGPWTQAYGRHWGDSLNDPKCPAGSREAFWAMLGRHQVVAHMVGHLHTYSGRLVTASGTRRNEVSAFDKQNLSFTTADGIWEVTTGQTHTSSGTLYTLVTVDNSVVTFETFDQVTAQVLEPFQLVEKWSVTVGSPPAVSITFARVWLHYVGTWQCAHHGRSDRLGRFGHPGCVLRERPADRDRHDGAVRDELAGRPARHLRADRRRDRQRRNNPHVVAGDRQCHQRQSSASPHADQRAVDRRGNATHADGECDGRRPAGRQPDVQPPQRTAVGHPRSVIRRVPVDAGRK